MDRSEAAAYLGRSVRWFAGRVSSGELPPANPRNGRWHRDDLDHAMGREVSQ
jgi:hypothetical protein